MARGEVEVGQPGETVGAETREGFVDRTTAPVDAAVFVQESVD